MAIRSGVVITPDNRGPIVNVVSWILIVISCLATLLKVWTKWSLAAKLQSDDYYLTGSTLATIGWVIAIAFQVDNGLGRHRSTLSNAQLVRFHQSLYTSRILYIISICLAKVAILHFTLSLARMKTRRRVVYAAMAINWLTMIVGIFIAAFQGPFPRARNVLMEKDFNQTTFWIVFGVMDILIDAITVILPFFLLHDLQITLERKIPAIATFALRFLIIPAVVARLILLKKHENSKDRTFDDFDLALATSVHINMSIIFTCLPFLKAVMEGLHTGLLAGDVHLRSPNRSQAGVYGQKGRGIYPGIFSSQQRSRGARSHPSDLATSNERNPNDYTNRFSDEEHMVINQTTTISLKSERMKSPWQSTSPSPAD